MRGTQRSCRHVPSPPWACCPCCWPPVTPRAGTLTEPCDPGFASTFAGPTWRDAVRTALEGATLRPERAGCLDIFTDFADANGRSLQSRLDGLGLTAAAYLETLGFRDGLALDRCRPSHVLALTAPGSRIVWVCSAFTPTLRRDPGLAEVVVLHEAMHSLGLQENPPSSLEVTHEIVERCGR